MSEGLSVNTHSLKMTGNGIYPKHKQPRNSSKDNNHNCNNNNNNSSSSSSSFKEKKFTCGSGRFPFGGKKYDEIQLYILNAHFMI